MPTIRPAYGFGPILDRPTDVFQHWRFSGATMVMFPSGKARRTKARRTNESPTLNASCKASGFLLRLTGWTHVPTSAASVAKWPKAPVCGTGDHGFEPRRSPQPVSLDAPVAQWIERWASDPEAAGSTPARRATHSTWFPRSLCPSSRGNCKVTSLCPVRMDSRFRGNDGWGGE